MVFLLMLAFFIITGLEVPGLVRKKMWRELTAFSVLLVFGMALSIPQALGMTIPNPNAYIEIIFKPLVQWLQK
ncbi:hypothetical protein [Desulfallas thermosapovorans]|uniref:Uncharacterized protein n=1 Tax=Desulfallas thermosapovorans DSM 6562 TaxID=1121431 RepID=A0A5S4ZX65_9FIRM|nr:hypothetical protein [Desulfallas thermosapovorans]TYO97300.1 hypothetical protein LX24_00491 [Desulfallas thermosapovorans DSM 6562]